MKYFFTILLSLFLPLLFPISLQDIETDDQTFDPVVIELEPTQEELILENMTIEEKVGQLFIFGFDGTTLNSEIENFFRESNLGGVLLLEKNISTEEQLKQLIQKIQTTNDIPLFISIDQEGGIVSRIKGNEILTKAQSQINDSAEAYSTAKSRGGILKSYGINMNLAPVVEYITNVNSFMYNRVYRGSREEVINKGISTIEGYTDAGIISVPKHYPGHSNTSVDSHLALPTVNITGDEWTSYIEPFSKILEQTPVNAIMVGHIKYPNIDNNPATLSTEIITNRLIQDLEYEGLIISDDMEMGALEDIDSPVILAKQALLAGNDILIYSKYRNDHPDLQWNVYSYIVEEVTNGNIDLDIIDEKVFQILKIKIGFNILDPENYY
jgi:beta-N-acetylhexosaminidase